MAEENRNKEEKNKEENKEKSIQKESWLRNILINLSILFVALLLSFGIGEIGVRLFKSNELAPGIWPEENAHFVPEIKRNVYPNIPNLSRSTSEFTYTVSTNSNGFRDFHEYEKKEGVYRIVGIGTSSMFGNTVEANDTYIARLGDITGTETINLGLGAIGFDEINHILKEYALRYKPNLILLEAELGDIQAAHLFYSRESTSKEKSFFLWWYEHSRFINHFYWKLKTTSLGYILVQFFGLNKNGQDANAFDIAFSEHKEDKNINQSKYFVMENLKAIKSLADEKGIPLIVIFIPPTFQLNSDKYEQIVKEYGLDTNTFDVAAAEHFFSDASSLLNITFFDSTALLLNRSDVKYLDWHFDGHFNAHGNYVYASLLAEFLRKEKIIES